MRRRNVSQVIRICLTLGVVLCLGFNLAAAQDNGRKRDRNQNDESPPANATSGLVDSDGDYLPDYLDNCPNVQNPDQVDSNGNGVGDLCEAPPSAPAAPAEPVEPPAEGELEVTGDAEAERIDETEWNPGIVTVDEPVSDEAGTDLAVAEDDGETLQEIDLAGGSGEGAAASDEMAAFQPSDGGALAPPGYSAVFVPPDIPIDDGQSQRRARPEPPAATYDVIARIDAGVVPAREGERSDAVGSVATSVDVAAFMRRDTKSPTLTDLGLQDQSRGLLPSPTPAPAPEPEPAPAAAPSSAQEPVGVPPAFDWDYDAHYAGGLARDRLAVSDIAGTDEPDLYYTQRRGDARGKPGEFSYAIPVPGPGVYQVRLHFAEIYWGAEGGAPGGRNKRVFSVDAEDEPMLVDYDIYDDVGPMTAVVKQFSVEVVDDVLNLRFHGKRDQPMVAGIEVLGAPTGERWLDVDMTARTVRLMVGGTPTAEYVASFGEPGHETPAGSFAIQHKIAELTWTPYGQNYFQHWAAFDQGNELGFHSWSMDAGGQLVGNADGPTWGCIATAPADAAAIYDFVEVGTRVEISY